MKKTAYSRFLARAAVTLLAVFSFSGARAQETLTVNDGTTTDEYVPVYGYYVDTQGITSEFIIPANTEGMSGMVGGTISKVTFYLSGSPATWGSPTIQLYLGEVEGTTLSGVNGPTNFTVVKTMVWSNQQSTIEVEFDEPYTYGGGNLLIGTYVQSKGGYKHTYFLGVSAPSGSGYCHYSNNNSSRSFLPKTTFTYEPADDDCPKPKNLAASNVTAHTAELSWESEGTAFILQYKKASDSDWTEEWLDVNEEEYENPYTLTGLASATEYQVRVQAHSEGCGTDPETGDDIFSDYREITFTTLESCVTPTDLAASKVTAYEATITWTSDAEAWQICVNDDEEHLIDVTGEATHTLTGLTPQTTYNVKVRTNCGNEYSNWKTMTFTTACGAVTTFPWSDDFESYEASGQGITFDHPCWVNEHISGNGSNFFEVYSGTTMGGNSTKMLRLPDMSSGTMTKLMLPEMTLPGDNYMFSIDVYRNNSTKDYGEGIRVFVSTNGEIGGATELAFISRSYTTSDGNLIPAESASGWYTYEIPLGISGTCYIILRGESKYGSSTYMDNFVVEMVPTCRKPTGVNASAVTKRSATIGWTSDATEWVVAYKADADEDFTEIPAVTENPYILTGLTPETAYTVKVRTNCGGGDYSDWTAPVNFTTDIACPVPTALQANNISAYVAELNWTSDASQWDIAYRANGSDEFTEITGVTQKPYTLQDLNPETTYVWKVRAYYPEEEGYSTWTSLSSFTTNETCPTPTDLHATAVRSTSADVAWTGSIDVTDYTVRYRVPQHVADGIYETFDTNSIPSGWSRYNGKLNNDGTATLNSSSSGFSFGTSNGVFDSHARINIYANYQRWLITPRFTLAGSTLSFDMALTAYSGSVSAPATSGTDDRFIVLISTDNMATWTILREWNNSGSEYVYNNITCTKTGEQVSISLNDYIGQDVHIAFYGESTVNNADNNLHIDNVLIGQMVPATEWQTVSTTETNATLTGLTPTTDYEVQVKSNCSDPEAWSTTLKFTTLTNFELANDDSQAEAEGKNSAIIAANAGNKADVTLSGRTLYKDGNWNTICLPFDVVDGDKSDELTFTGTPLEGAIAKTLTDATVTNNGENTHIELTFGDDVTSLDAGIPYIIKWEPEENADIVNPVFSGVTIVETSNEHRIISPANGVWFIGYYDAFGIGATDTNIFYMTSDNQLKYTASDRTLKSCRAYFRFSDATPKARTFTLNFGDGSEATGIISTKNSPDSTNDGWYTVDGMKLGKQPKRKGVYIQNGRKVVIK